MTGFTFSLRTGEQTEPVSSLVLKEWRCHYYVVTAKWSQKVFLLMEDKKTYWSEKTITNGWLDLKQSESMDG